MSVTGYLALYTTLIGWQQYQNLWAVMIGTGMVFIPFIGIVMKCFIEPFESQEPKNAAIITMRRLMIRIVGALLVIEFCCVPTVPLNPSVLHFEPVCVSNAKVATPGHTGTTYDNQFHAITGIKVPILWYLVMAVSNGFTHAAIEGMQCSPINYRQLQTQLDLTNIANPQTKQETVAFFNDCYVPSYAKYLSGNMTDGQKRQIQQYQKQYGKSDLGWVGSQAFLKTPGFYNAHFARKPVNGFLYEARRDKFEGQVRHHSKWGQPSCSAWWSVPQVGLRAKLVKTLPSNFIGAIGHIGSDPNALEDSGIRNLIKHSFDSGMSLGEISRGYESLDDDMHGDFISRYIGGKVGVGYESMSFYPKMHLLVNALPVVQALLLMGVYMFLAIMIPFASYRFSFIITGAAFIFAITFWSYLWHLVLYVDNYLIPALYPAGGSGSVKNVLEVWLQGNGESSDTTFINFIVSSLYIGLPSLFLIVMSWTGFKMGNIIGSMMGQMTSTVESAGNKAGQAGQQVVQTAVGVVTKAIK